MKRRFVISLLVVSLGLVAIAAAQGLRAGNDHADAPAGSTGVEERFAGFSISGQVSRLFPGQRASLALALGNPYGFAIEVTSIRVRVESRKRGCSAYNLVVKRFHGKLAIPGRSSRRLKLKARLRPGAPAACQGATFPLSYTGKAVRP